MQPIRAATLLERHRVFLIDAYGVLVTSAGAIPGARDFVLELKRRGLSYRVLTNDASRLPETAAAFYHASGLDIDPGLVITAGDAIGAALNERHGQEARCLVLGTDETQAIVERAGHQSVAIELEAEFDALVIGDDSGFDFLTTMNTVLSALHRQTNRGRLPSLLLANSDLLYPRGSGRYGFTSGAMARLLEQGLQQLHPDLEARFETIGKPARRLFDLAIEQTRAGPGEAVMLGDQLHTDVRGAHNAGIASALVATGLTRLPLPNGLSRDMTPTYLLEHLRL